MEAIGQFQWRDGSSLRALRGAGFPRARVYEDNRSPAVHFVEIPQILFPVLVDRGSDT